MTEIQNEDLGDLPEDDETLLPIPEHFGEAFDISADGEIKDGRAKISGRLGTASITFEFDLADPEAEDSGLIHMDVLINSAEQILRSVIENMKPVEDDEAESEEA